MRSLLPLILYCISLVSLQQLTSAREESPNKYRLGLLNKLFYQREDNALDSGRHLPAWRGTTGLPSLAWARPPPASQVKQMALRASRHVTRTLPSLAWARATVGPQMEQRLLRVRRHAPSGARGGHHYSHNAQLMRVGCVLGTCQVQNLSHRLYQLIGQSGREDSSPINPRSPHSYG